MPERIQRKRTKGWRMPKNTVYVGRPTVWGNPFPAKEYGRIALSNYESRIRGMMAIGFSLESLRGKDLACWCKEGAPCHADILLRLANAE